MEEEPIPPEDTLYKRVHRNLVKEEGGIKSGAFNDYELSVNWKKYANDPEETRKGERSEAKDNAVISLKTADVREIPQEVVYRPKPENLAHSLIIGNKSTKVRYKLRELSHPVIWPDNFPLFSPSKNADYGVDCL